MWERRRMSSFAEESAYCTLNARECVFVATVISLRQQHGQTIGLMSHFASMKYIYCAFGRCQFSQNGMKMKCWPWTMNEVCGRAPCAVYGVHSTNEISETTSDRRPSVCECVTVRKRVYEWRILAQLCINYNFIIGRKSVRACECVQCSAHGKCWRCFFLLFFRISQLKWKICPKFPRHGVAWRVSSSLFLFSFHFFARKTFA